MIFGTNYIFIPVPKNASTSLSNAIITNPHHAYHNPLSGKPFPGLEDFGNSHVPLQRASQHLDVSKLYKIAFCRNPWDRFVSYCAWTRAPFVAPGEEPFLFKDRPQKYMELQLRYYDVISKNTTMIWRQMRFMSLDDQFAMDFVGRYETLQESYNELCNKMGWKKRALPKRNVGVHDDYRKYYTPALVDAVGDFYKCDVEQFGYTFE